MRRLLGILVALPTFALAQSSHFVQLTWTPSTVAGTKVNVYRAHNSCSGAMVKIALNQPNPTYTDTLVISGATYAYQVTATLNGIESPPSNCVVATIPPDTPVSISAPTTLTATPQ